MSGCMIFTIHPTYIKPALVSELFAVSVALFNTPTIEAMTSMTRVPFPKHQLTRWCLEQYSGRLVRALSSYFARDLKWISFFQTFKTACEKVCSERCLASVVQFLSSSDNEFPCNGATTENERPP